MTNIHVQPSRERVSSRPADVYASGDLIDAALAAFARDVSYAVAMAQAATSISHKRAVWAARRELRAAEAQARAECEQVSTFHCHAEAPCGVGGCKFANAELSRLDVAAAPGPTRRPQPSDTSYTLESAVGVLAAQRTGSARRG